MTIQIETNHAIGDNVFFLKDDKIKTGVVYKIEITIEETSWKGNAQLTYLFVRDANHEVAVVSEDRAFTSKEQLIQSL